MRITTISLFLAIVVGLALGASSLLQVSSPLDEISSLVVGREAQAPASPAAQQEVRGPAGNPMPVPEGGAPFVGPTGPPTIKGPSGPPPQE